MWLRGGGSGFFSLPLKGFILDFLSWWGSLNLCSTWNPELLGCSFVSVFAGGHLLATELTFLGVLPKFLLYLLLLLLLLPDLGKIDRIKEVGFAGMLLALLGVLDDALGGGSGSGLEAFAGAVVVVTEVFVTTTVLAVDEVFAEV